VFVNKELRGILGTKREKNGENCITRSFMVYDLLTEDEMGRAYGTSERI
jgi:hypothetical protein